jgi:hypothetical protein
LLFGTITVISAHQDDGNCGIEPFSFAIKTSDTEDEPRWAGVHVSFQTDGCFEWGQDWFVAKELVEERMCTRFDEKEGLGMGP